MTVYINTPAENYIEWKSGNKLLYKQIYFTIDNFRGFVYRLVYQIRVQLVDQLIIYTDYPVSIILWNALYNDIIQNISR